MLAMGADGTPINNHVQRSLFAENVHEYRSILPPTFDFIALVSFTLCYEN